MYWNHNLIKPTFFGFWTLLWICMHHFFQKHALVLLNFFFSFSLSAFELKSKLNSMETSLGDAPSVFYLWRHTIWKMAWPLEIGFLVKSSYFYRSENPLSCLFRTTKFVQPESSSLAIGWVQRMKGRMFNLERIWQTIYSYGLSSDFHLCSNKSLPFFLIMWEDKKESSLFSFLVRTVQIYLASPTRKARRWILN